MKYIRTKDGRISYLSSKPNEEIECYEIITSKGTITYRREDEVIKIANTIPELCDGFIITSKQGHIYDSYGDYNYELREVLPEAREECPDEEWDLYGCILVDGIIKQVAKTKGILPNGKIDWELL